MPLHASVLLLRQKIRVQTVVDVLLATWWGAGHRAVGRVLAVTQTLG